MDTLIGKKTYSCEPATEEELSEFICGRDFLISTERMMDLRRKTLRVLLKRIPWASVQSLFVLGDMDSIDSTLADAGFATGAYINHYGDCLFLIYPDSKIVHQIINRIGIRLKKLVLRGVELPQLDLTSATSLRAFHTYECYELSSIIGMERLTNLTELVLQETPLLDESIRLENLTQLTTLCIVDNRALTQLSSFENLTQLTSLTLVECDNLQSLSGLENLTQLTSLTLDECDNLQTLSGLENLSQLTHLELSYCYSLPPLPSLKKMTQLHTLSLEYYPGLQAVPDEIRNMKLLRKLDLSLLALKDLPDWLPEITESFSLHLGREVGKEKAIVYLLLTSVDTIPDMSIFEQPYEVVAEWFKNRALGRTRPLNEIKVVFLGDGEAGKSHTIARLMNDGGDPKGYVNVRTPGIVIKDVEYPIGDRNATLHLWDFGGQDIMHSMHRIFLTERTIYVVLVDGSIGNQDERARYWLQNIRSFAKDAPIVLVLNKLDDGLQADVNAVDLYNKYKGLKQIIKLSALQYPQERFNREFKDVLLEEISKTGYLDAQWPISWIQVKHELEHMDDNYIHGSEYLKICKKQNVDTNQKNLLKWFHDLGISFCYCDDKNRALEDYVVLKPNWITNALYIILFNEREGGNGGLVPINTIRNMLSEEALNRDAIKRVIPDAYYAGYDVNYVLDVFHAFRLSFRKDEDHEFFPMLADVNAKPVAGEYAADKACLEFNMEFDYLPSNLLHRLMVERHTELDMDNVWRTGAKFQLKELGYSAVVVIDGNILRFFIRHTDPMHRPNTYLTMLKANVDRIVEKMGLKAPACKLVYKLDGKRDEFDYEEVKLNWELGDTTMTSRAHRKKVLIEDILNQSAPDGMADQLLLLNEIRSSCGKMQDEPLYRLIRNPDGRGYANGLGMEDLRNRRLRDDLLGKDYRVADQTQRGTGRTGAGMGEVDLLLTNDRNEPWTIIEALRVTDGTKGDWNSHLDKLLAKYNTRGLPVLYLLTYVDADPTAFGNIWRGYQDHIRKYDPEKHIYCEKSFTDLNDDSSPLYIKTAKCLYTSGDKPVTVYHIFARIPTQDE